MALSTNPGVHTSAKDSDLRQLAALFLFLNLARVDLEAHVQLQGRGQYQHHCSGGEWMTCYFIVFSRQMSATSLMLSVHSAHRTVVADHGPWRRGRCSCWSCLLFCGT